MSDIPLSSAHRLERTLSEIAQLVHGRLPSRSLSVAARQENVDRAAMLMIELYGDCAREYALRLEQRSAQPSFARAVRERVQSLDDQDKA